MKLGWHIIRKDLRRMALPVGLWLAFLLATALWFSWLTPDMQGHAASEIGAWTTMASIWIRLLVGAQFLFGYLLAGSLVLEDAPIGSDGFWMTRPIGAMRLLAAKAGGAGLLFVVGPTAVLVPVWFASGFTLDETMRAIGDVALWQGAVTLVALGVASLARNLVQFLLCTVGLYVAFNLCMVIDGLPWFSRNVPPALWRSRTILVQTAVFPVMLAVLVQQFLVRKTSRSWLIIGLVLLACGTIRVAWPWDFWSDMTARKETREFADHPADRAANIVVASSFKRRARTGWLPHLDVVAPWSREQFFAPVGARRRDGSAGMTRFGNWGETACLRAIGFDPGEGPLTWQFTLQPERSGGQVPENPHFTGELDVWVARARVMGEMPLQVDAALSKAQGRTRIVSLTRGEGGRLDEIFIEERESGSVSELRDYDARQKFHNRSHIDHFLLIQRVRGEASLLSASEMGAVELHGQRIAFRRLFVSGMKDWREAVLVKVRVERLRSFQRPIDVRGVTIQGEEARP